MDINSHWYRPTFTFLTLLLLPFSWLFKVVIFIRYFLYKLKIIKTVSFSVPVIVVGNITVGGTGKTPFVIGLVTLLVSHGFKPGIVSRGVGGKKVSYPRLIEANSRPEEMGDEAILLAKRAGCPVVIGADRVRAVQYLLAETDCNIVISDDGLQHYRLGRTVEIALIDGTREYGNGCFLPAGPLRESPRRLNTVNFILKQGGVIKPGEYEMHFQSLEWISVKDEYIKKTFTDFYASPVHAIAGIGNPARFFEGLKTEGLTIIPHAFRDHYLYKEKDLQFDDDYPVLMTEKDAVKCKSFKNNKLWYLVIEVKMSEAFIHAFLSFLKELKQ